MNANGLGVEEVCDYLWSHKLGEIVSIKKEEPL
jgi:hypothetical protein